MKNLLLIVLSAIGIALFFSAAPAVPAYMAFVEAGTFMMGSPETEKGRDANEGPRHKVALSPFFISKYELTVGEFRRFAESADYKTTAESGADTSYWKGQWWHGQGRSWRNPGFPQSDRDPVVCLSWYDAAAYCNWRSAQEGMTALYSYEGIGTDFSAWPAGWNIEIHDLISLDRESRGYRLPTEAEWEYSARGGVKSKGFLYSGTNNLKDLDPYGAGWRTKPVGSMKANELGLFDMSGSAWEWCHDWFSKYTTDAQTDPIGPEKADASDRVRIIRGGDWRFANTASFRNANRGYDCYPSFVTIYSGFRIALQPGKGK